MVMMLTNILRRLLCSGGCTKGGAGAGAGGGHIKTAYPFEDRLSKEGTFRGLSTETTHPETVHPETTHPETTHLETTHSESYQPETGESDQPETGESDQPETGEEKPPLDEHSNLPQINSDCTPSDSLQIPERSTYGHDSSPTNSSPHTPPQILSRDPVKHGQPIKHNTEPPPTLCHLASAELSLSTRSADDHSSLGSSDPLDCHPGGAVPNNPCKTSTSLRRPGSGVKPLSKGASLAPIDDDTELPMCMQDLAALSARFSEVQEAAMQAMSRMNHPNSDPTKNVNELIASMEDTPCNRKVSLEGLEEFNERVTRSTVDA